MYEQKTKKSVLLLFNLFPCSRHEARLEPVYFYFFLFFSLQCIFAMPSITARRSQENQQTKASRSNFSSPHGE
ncbi:hypothetical protein TSAR_013433 [Trichomalopsis sarcophagae]|uniref:Uncharacterized protein n=1 Tax=Trichomalopsis sarcophagae TaxID=543379 RepID=A0A232EXG6_9HYME|nr:hypothetical protein TSAR_013433 [Trichomalopsis sarcophagae]